MKDLNTLLTECLQDGQRRERLLEAPKVYLEQEGYTVPESIQLEVHQSTPRHIHIVVPAASCAGNINTQLADNIYKQIVIKALTELGFRNRLFDDPRQVFEEYYEISLEPETRVQAHWMNETHWVFILPSL